MGITGAMGYPSMSSSMSQCTAIDNKNIALSTNWPVKILPPP